MVRTLCFFFIPVKFTVGNFGLYISIIKAPEARRNPTGIIHQATIMGSTELNPMFSFKRSPDLVFEMLPA